MDHKPTLVTAPREGLPPIINSTSQLPETAAKIGHGEGPLAVDTERASGFTYSQRAQLIQIRRTKSGSFLIDPVAFSTPTKDLQPIASVINNIPWILHAADQDLPCLGEVGFKPPQLADTLIAGRLLSYKKCNLGNLISQVLNVKLPKNHSAENWSRRPLPQSWLKYAALDVEYLIELWEALENEAREMGRWEWIVEECAYELSRPPAPPRKDPWRRTSQIHRLNSRRELEIVRQIWTSRDRLAQQKDLAPGRVIPDRMIIALAQNKPTTMAELSKLKGGRRLRYKKRWLSSIDKALTTPKAKLPKKSINKSNIPHHSRWKRHHKQAHQVLTTCKKVTANIASDLDIETQDLIAGDALRQLSWSLGEKQETFPLRDKLTELNVRQWQQNLVAKPLARALELSL